ncbi:MAG: DsrE family protein [Gammaproteobacteria bacterium]|nr:DsrE family protein [Gammaproteobacteria bacterium]MCW8987969.1 DsrE family protein [Gammaproteobacteria bacterium]MCW9030437.1 DsrE family protein [Gammaproteobacteria bacterium]
MKVAVVIYSNDAETVWNAYRFANTCRVYEDEVTIFLMGKGVEAASIQSLKFNIEEQIQLFEEQNGTVIGCGVCCETRKDIMPGLKDDLQCTLGSMQDFYILIKESDKVITF